MSVIAESMQRLTEWLASQYPDGLEDLNPPSTDAELEQLSQVLGFALPVELVEMLKIHNGQAGEAGYLFDGQEFLSTERIAEEWQTCQGLQEKGRFKGGQPRAEAGIRKQWWSPGWVPFTSNGFGDNFCIDTDPAESGLNDQVITFWKEMSERDRLAENLSDWLKDYTLALKAGEFVYADDYGAVLHKDDI